MVSQVKMEGENESLRANLSISPTKRKVYNLLVFRKGSLATGVPEIPGALGVPGVHEVQVFLGVVVPGTGFYFSTMPLNSY